MKPTRLLSPRALEVVAARFRILGERQRLSLLQHLRSGERSVTELAELLETSQPNVSKHLRLLQEGGLVARRQEKNVVWYSIADETVFALCDLVCSRLRNQFEAEAEALRPAPRSRARRSG